MTKPPQPLAPAERALHRMFIDAWRKAARAEREANAVLRAMNQRLVRGRRP